VAAHFSGWRPHRCAIKDSLTKLSPPSGQSNDACGYEIKDWVNQDSPESVVEAGPQKREKELENGERDLVGNAYEG
jgi:hypothetical protein